MPPLNHQAPSFKGRSYAALLFDMDGTMLDSSIVVERIWRAWADRHGIDAVALLATVHGVRSEDTVRRFAPVGTEIAKEVEWLLQAEVADVEGVIPVAGIEALVSGLDPAVWAIVTSASRVLAEARLRAVGLPIPVAMITAEDVECGKPAPEGYLKAAERLGVPIAECLIFEDSPSGVAAAKAAGAHVAVVGGRVPPSDGMLAIVDFR